MSRVFRSIKKVFKKVTKSVIGKIAVGIAVSFLTAGLGAAVLGATGLSASLSPVLGTVLSHSISGAAAGALTAGLSGENLMKGAAFGGVGGAVTGGVQSYLGNYTPVKGGWKPSDTANEIGGQAASQAPNAVQSTGVPDAQGSVINTNTAKAGAAAVQPVSTTPLPPPSPGGTGLLNPATTAAKTAPTFMDSAKVMLKDNQQIIGGAMSGLGQGMLSSNNAAAIEEASAARAESEAQTKRDEVARISESHNGVTGLLTPETNTLNSDARPNPADRFNPENSGGTWVYDPSMGRVVFVKNQAA